MRAVLLLFLVKRNHAKVRIGLVLNLLEDASLLGPLRHNGAKIQIPKNGSYVGVKKIREGKNDY